MVATHQRRDLHPRTATKPGVVIAKLAAGVLLSVVASTTAFLTGIAAVSVFDLLGGTATWDLSIDMVGAFALLHMINVLTGFAFGMLILNTPAAIVTFVAYSFVQPTLFMSAASRWDWAESIQPWIDFNHAQDPLTDATLSGVNWAQFTATAMVWFVAPVALGVRRLLRAEIK